MNIITIPPPQPARDRGRLRAAARTARLIPARLRHGRPAILTLRTLGALVLAEAAAHSGAGPAPVTGTLAGIAAWYLASAPADLAPAPPDTP